MVKRTITITTILLVLSMIIGLIIVLNKSSFAADDDIASGTSGNCSWVIDKNGVMTISPISGTSGVLAYVNDGYWTSQLPWVDYRNDVLKLVIEPGVKTNDWCSHLFSFPNCTEMDISNLDTSRATAMYNMFLGCSSLTSIDVSHFNMSNVSSTNGMFQGCSSLKNIDVSMWDASKINYIYNMFQGCSSIESLDLSNFNCAMVFMGSAFKNCSSLKYLDISNMNSKSINVYANNNYLGRVFYGCEQLETIILGTDFSFYGKQATPSLEDYYAILPTPPTTDVYTGKWIREDGMYGPYTQEEMRYNYTSAMAGTWVWETKKYTVTYNYENVIPENASDLPPQEFHKVGEQVMVAPYATAIGYTFNGWSRAGTFEMPAEDVIITGSFTPNTTTKYKVEYYLEDLTGDTFTLKETEVKSGETGKEVIAVINNYEGFMFDETIDGTKRTGTIAEDESLVLKMYYRRKSYNISYSYTGEIPDNASELPPMDSFRYEEEIVVADDVTAEGYTFSGWIKDYINMPAHDIEITGYFIEIPKSYSYKVEYFFDGEMDNSLEEIMNAKKDEEISINPQSPLKHGEKNYTLVSNNHNITISINDEDNIINVYYESDVLDYEFEYPEGDGIPDKYQVKITYRVENGSWNDGTSEIKTNIVTLYDEYGNLSKDGIGAISLPDVGNKPADGYTKGSWNKEIRNKISSKDDGNEYIYTYKKLETAKADIVEPGEKGANPKTGDIFYRYIVYGVLGMIVLMTAIKIRRKYSRKARKIQY